LPEAAVAAAVEAVAAAAEAVVAAAVEAVAAAEVASLEAVVGVAAAAAACHGEAAARGASSEHFGDRRRSSSLMARPCVVCFAALPICQMGSLAYDDAKVKH
jgi:hypothetical protein